MGATSLLGGARGSVHLFFEVGSDVCGTIPDERSKLYVRATLTQQPVATDACDTSLRDSGVVVLGEKGFQLGVSGACAA
jgi:hypothetical protein